MKKRTKIDHTQFREKGSKPPIPGFIDEPIHRWWKTEDKYLPDAVMAQVQTILTNDRPRIDRYNTYVRLYGNHSLSTWNGYQINKFNTLTNPSRDRIGYNVIQSCVDTLASKIAKAQPKPFFLTQKGDSKVQRRAKGLNDFSNGVFYENNSGEMGIEAFRHCCVMGDGIIHVFGDQGRVKWERVMPYEILVDYLESHYGPDSTKTIHRIKNIDRETLVAEFPDKEAEIMSMHSTNDLLSGTTRSVSDTVTVVESWRLPSAPGKKDGLHCMVAPGIVLQVDREYDKPFFPFAIMRYSNRIYGFWGQSLAEQLMPLQIEINRCLITIQRSFHLGGSFKVLLKNGSRVVKSHLDNTIGAIIEWAGDVPPQYITPPLVPAEIYRHLETLKTMAYEQSGISQLSASSQKPSGLDSGKALREMNDIETDRFQVVGQAFEKFHLDLAKLSISVAKDIEESGENIKVKVPGKKFIKTIDWKDVNLEEDQYVMQCFPISKLPSSPEGRLQSVQEMMQGGLIEPAVGRRLLDFPDLDAEENLANASLDWIHEMLDKIVDDGEFIVPDPYDDLATAKKMALEYYQAGKRDNLDQSRLELLRRFMNKCDDLVQASQPVVPPQPQGQRPQANPTPTPTSDLLPNVNQPATAA